MLHNQPISNSTEKLRELILYIAEQSECDSAFGVTKLNTLLFFSDFQAYLSTGNSITGQEYQKLPNGPAPRQMVLVMQTMQESGALAIAERSHFGHAQKRPFALREANLSAFSGTEIAVIDRAIQRFRHMDVSAIRATSQAFIGWQSVEEYETIPYASVLIDTRELTRQELEWAKELDTTGLEELLAL